MISFMIPMGQTWVPKTSDKAIPGFAVCYKEDNKEVRRWHIVEDSDKLAPNNDLNEYPPDHKISLEMLGKGVGDKFYLRKDSLQDKEATITKVISKYVYRHCECKEKFEERFPEVKSFQSFDALKPDGEFDLEPMRRLAQESQNRGQLILELYREQKAPLFMVAALMGKSMIGAMSHITGDSDLKLHCCSGFENEYRTAMEALGKTDYV
jgi:hypothetical protein